MVPPGIEVRASGDDEFGAWLGVALDGFTSPDTAGPPHEGFPRAVLERALRDLATPGLRRYVAVCDGVVAGAASMSVEDGLAQFTGAATLPAHRGRGIQTALLSARLADAAAAGCDLAVVTTAPASRSQRNAQSCGFGLLYTRAILVRPPHEDDRPKKHRQDVESGGARSMC